MTAASDEGEGNYCFITSKVCVDLRFIAYGRYNYSQIKGTHGGVFSPNWQQLEKSRFKPVLIQTIKQLNGNDKCSRGLIFPKSLPELYFSSTS